MARTPRTRKVTAAQPEVESAVQNAVQPQVETPAQTVEEPKVAAKKPATRTTTKKIEEVYLQFGEKEWDVAQLKEQVKALYVEQGNKATTLKKLCLYVKPEEGKAYYVINDDVTGSIAL